MNCIIDFIFHELMEGPTTTQLLVESVNLEFNTAFTYKQIYSMLLYYERTQQVPIQKLNTGKYAYWTIKY